MKRFLICIGTILATSGALQASGIIACSGVANSSNSCYTSYLQTFTTQVQWNSLQGPGAQDNTGNPYSATWTESTFTVSGMSLVRAEDYAEIIVPIFGGSLVINPNGNYGFPYQFTGSFDSAPDTGFKTSGVGISLGPYGEYLLGSKNVEIGGVQYNAGPITVGSPYALTSFAFRIAAITDATFGVTINLYSSADGSGTPVQTLSENNLGGGGNCSGLSGNPPVPCNMAPLLYVSTTGVVRSFSIQTSDPTGFYIDALDLSTPEPATMLFTGIGLLSLAFAIRRKRNAKHLVQK